MEFIDIINEITAEYITPGKCVINGFNFEVYFLKDENTDTCVIMKDDKLFLSYKCDGSNWSEFEDISDKMTIEEFKMYLI